MSETPQNQDNFDRQSPPDIPVKSMVGKTVLVQMNCYTVENTLLAQKQFHGEVVSANEDKGVVLNLTGLQSGRLFFLPYDVTGYRPAPPGEYHIRSTGETIKNPDFIINWDVKARSPK